MNSSYKNAMYEAILNKKWLEINYQNKDGEITNYFIAIKDIDIKNKKIYCDIFNPFKSLETISDNVYIYLDKILKAKVAYNTYYEYPQEFLKKVAENPYFSKFFELEKLDNNILRYLSECYALDSDPTIKDSVILDGVDNNELLKERSYKLDDNQFDKLLNYLFRKEKTNDLKKITSENLAINVFSIDILGKQYIVAYRNLSVDFKNKKLIASNTISINKSFLLDENGKTVSLQYYLDVDSESFEEGFKEDHRKYIDIIEHNYRHGEKTNTRPNIFILARTITKGVEEAFEAVNKLELENKLTIPLKSFFARNINKSGSNKEVSVVVFNKYKINIDQMRVIYNAMVNHVTYIKGPPGTGKTETIFNVILSSYVNNKKVLICSNNNHPLDDIYNRMISSFTNNNINRQIIFPILRITNNNDLIIAINRLKEAYNFAVENKNVNTRESRTEAMKNTSLDKFKTLKEMLFEYEERKEIELNIDKLRKFTNLAEFNVLTEQVKKQLKAEYEKLKSLRIIKDDEVNSLAISASDDINFQLYLYYDSLQRYKKLLTDKYKDLRDIILNTNELEAVIAFNKYIRDDENFKILLNIFPLIICTNLSCEKLGKPTQYFDLCIMDEAAQCNIASSFIPIIRADNLLLVGDINQLQPVTVLEKEVNKNLREKYHIKEDYDYIHNSILSTMLKKDKNSKVILLSYHYRCAKRIANFANNRFYNNQLKLFNKDDGSLEYYLVRNKKIADVRNAYLEEAIQICDVVTKGNYDDVGIVTPFVNQANLINDLLKRRGIENVKAGTIHTLQGSEKNTIIMSSALSPKTSKRVMDRLKNNHELINVGVTRAKKKFIFVGDKEAIDALSKDDENNDLKLLSDYVYSNGKVVVPPLKEEIATNFSNESDNEKQFFETIKPYFNKRGSKMKIERNVKIVDAIPNLSARDKELAGEKEFDVIVRYKPFIYRKFTTIVAFEIDGGEHIGSNIQSRYDRLKERISKEYGIKIIRISNAEVKDYELIIKLFECVIRKLDDIDEVSEQLSLLED